MVDNSDNSPLRKFKETINSWLPSIEQLSKLKEQLSVAPRYIQQKSGDLKNYSTACGLPEVASSCKKFALDRFDEFELITGTQLPEPSSRLAELRAAFNHHKKEFDDALTVKRSSVSVQKANVERLKKSYEEQATILVEMHEDAQDFKMLSESISKECDSQSNEMDGLARAEMRQISFQAKDVASNTALLAMLFRQLNSGSSFESQLSGLLGFQSLSQLADSDRDVLIFPSMIHRNIMSSCRSGVPTSKSLKLSFEKLFGKAQQVSYSIPQSGVAGRMWASFAAATTTATGVGFTAIKDSIDAGKYDAAYDQISQWSEEHNNKTVEVLPDVVGLFKDIETFQQQVGTTVRCFELQRYLSCKLRAQQLSLLAALK